MSNILPLFKYPRMFYKFVFTICLNQDPSKVHTGQLLDVWCIIYTFLLYLFSKIIFPLEPVIIEEARSFVLKNISVWILWIASIWY